MVHILTSAPSVASLLANCSLNNVETKQVLPEFSGPKTLIRKLEDVESPSRIASRKDFSCSLVTGFSNNGKQLHNWIWRE